MTLKNWIQRGLISLFASLMFLGLSGAAHAFSFEHQEIALERFGNILYSPIIEMDEPFNTVVLKFDQVEEGLMANFNPLEGGKWELLEVHDDGYGAESFVFTALTNTIQLRKLAEGDEQTVIAKVDFIHAEVPDDEEVYAMENLYAGEEVAARSLKIISRKGWGADENLRFWTPEIEDLFRKSGKTNEYINPCGDMDQKYRNEVRITRVINESPRGDTLVWPITYTDKLKKIVVHHTDSDLKDLNGDHRTDSRDYVAMVRAIYYFHAISRGWGDIGYNYIIDPLGNIYEGRYGGDRAIGAHAQCYNSGSMGIALIGDYQKNKVPQPALDSLIALIGNKSRLYKIDPMGTSSFRGKTLPNIIGHKDVRPTACPGRNLYGMLKRIRERSALAARSIAFREPTAQVQALDYNAESLSQVSMVYIPPNQRKTITLRFKNTGKKTWDRNTWLHVALNNNINARVVPIIEGKNFVASDMKEKSVSPGQSATFEVEFESGYEPGIYTFEMAPVVNGRYKVSRSAIFVPIQVEVPHFDYRVVSHDLPSGVAFQGQKIHATMKLQNIGNVKWVNYGDHPIRLGTEGLRDRRSLLVKIHATRIAHLLESEVMPGEVGTFVFDLEVPFDYFGRLKERFTPVIEGVRWMDDRGLGFEMIIRKPRHQASIKNKTLIPKLLPGERKRVSLSMENKGDLPWENDNMFVNILGRGIKTFKKKLVPLKPVIPKSDVDFSFWIQAPYKEGRHRLFLQSKFNRVPIRGGTARFVIDVQKPKLRAQMVEQTDRTIKIQPGEEREIEVKFKNLGNVVWQSKGENAIHLGASRPQDRLSALYYKNGWNSKFRPAALVESEVYPGEVGTFRFKVRPLRKGVFRENFQLVIENVGWIDGSFVRWDFHVFGKIMTESASTTNKDASLNKKRASIITKAISETTGQQNRIIAERTDAKIVESNVTDDPFRVLISFTDDVSKITANTNFSVLNKNGELLFEAGAGAPVELRRLYDNVHVQLGTAVKAASAVRIVPEPGGVVEILTMERRPTWNRKLNDNRFRGIMEIKPLNGETVFINELSMQDYLKGLAEVSNDAHSEKQKVIAILARTYARFYMEEENRKFPGMPYDGSDDPAIFQRYLGYGYEMRSPNFKSAVEETKDMVVTYRRELVKTPYFNQSDGRTRSAEEAWGWTNTPYLQSVADPYCAGMIKRGHGVGLSGCGADGMAKEGKGYEEIIKYYYQDVEIEQKKF